MNSNLTTLVVLVSVIHVAAMVVMIWIRVRRTEGDGIEVPGPTVSSCAVCGEPAVTVGYDGLDPNEQRDSRTGHVWSVDSAYYRPVCAAHGTTPKRLSAAVAS
ncbi:MAG TPA: hypothetical protein VGD91_12505 [Trebonia sp.]